MYSSYNRVSLFFLLIFVPFFPPVLSRELSISPLEISRPRLDVGAGFPKGEGDPFTQILPVVRSEVAARATTTQMVRGSESLGGELSEVLNFPFTSIDLNRREHWRIRVLVQVVI